MTFNRPGAPLTINLSNSPLKPDGFFIFCKLNRWGYLWRKVLIGLLRLAALSCNGRGWVEKERIGLLLASNLYWQVKQEARPAILASVWVIQRAADELSLLQQSLRSCFPFDSALIQKSLHTFIHLRTRFHANPSEIDRICMPIFLMKANLPFFPSSIASFPLCIKVGLCLRGKRRNFLCYLVDPTLSKRQDFLIKGDLWYNVLSPKFLLI